MIFLSRRKEAREMPNIMINNDPDMVEKLTAELKKSLSLRLFEDVVISMSLLPLWIPAIRASDNTSVLCLEQVRDACTNVGIEIDGFRWRPELKEDMVDLDILGFNSVKPYKKITNQIPDGVNLGYVRSKVVKLDGSPQPFAAIYQCKKTDRSDLDALFVKTAEIVNARIEIEVFWRGPDRVMTFHEKGQFAEWLEQNR